MVISSVFAHWTAVNHTLVNMTENIYMQPDNRQPCVPICDGIMPLT